MAIVYDYPVGVKREIINALRDVLGQTFPEPRLRDKIHVELTYPLDQVQYPAIYVSLNEGPIKNIGVGHYEVLDTITEDGGDHRKFLHWFFESQVNFQVMALDPYERDRIAAVLLNIIAFGRDAPEFKRFHDELADDDFIRLQFITDEIRPGGEAVLPTPWEGEDQQIFATTYSLAVEGEFYNDPVTAGLVRIDDVILYPYTPEQPVPQGDPNYPSIPWVGAEDFQDE